MIRKYLFFTLLLFFTNQVFAEMSVSLGVVHKRAIDEKLILTDEYYSIESPKDDGEIKLIVRESLLLDLMLKFIEEEGDYGPSSSIIVSGVVSNKRGQVLYSFEENPLKISLGSEGKVIFRNEDNNNVELTLRPRMISPHERKN